MMKDGENTCSRLLTVRSRHNERAVVEYTAPGKMIDNFHLLKTPGIIAMKESEAGGQLEYVHVVDVEA